MILTGAFSIIKSGHQKRHHFNLTMKKIYGNTKPPKGALINWAHPLSRGLVGCWLMNEGMGDKIYDLSGNKNTGTLINMAHPSTTVSGWNPGKFGHTLNLDGGNDYVECPSPTVSLNITKNITLTAWIKTTSSTDGLTVTGRGLTGTFDHTWQHYIGLGYNTFFYANLYAMAAADGIAGTVLINDGKWHHVVAQFNGTAISVYTDGKYDNSKAKTTTPTSNNNLKVRIGNLPGYTDYFNGSIEDVCIYNRALSAAEILQLYKEPFCIFNR